MTMKIVLIRHTSVNVARGICYGHSDVDLASSFPEEAAAVKSALSAYKFDKVYCSPLSSCRRLAAASGHESPVIDSRLLEMNFGEWEMMRYDDITDPRLQEWFDDYINVAPTGGESFMNQQARFLNLLEELKEKGDNCVALFTHCGILVQALVTLRGMTPQEAFANPPAYGTVMEINID